MDALAFNISSIILVANITLAFVIVFMERRNPASTLAWVLVLMFIPVLGFILYLFMGQDLRRVKVFSSLEDLSFGELKGKYDNPLDEEGCDAVFKTDGDLIDLHRENAGSIYTSNNKITILKNGRKKFAALAEALEGAKHHIHMEYYIIRNDEIGRKIRDILARKAREGVAVKLLYDGMGSLKLPSSYTKPLLDSGGQAHVFYPPFLPHINVRLNYRNHRKITVIDGNKAFFGGFNLGDEYLGKSRKYGFWRDTHFTLEGDAVDSLQLQFIYDWQFASKKKMNFDRAFFPNRGKVGSCGVQIVPSGPDTKWESIYQGFFKLISKAKTNVYIQTPYFIPDQGLAEALNIAALGGVDVRIMIPSFPDHPFVHWASTSFLSELLDSGARAFVYKKGFLHSKILAVDGRVASIGTSNFDMRSFKMNFEINAAIYDKATVSKLEGQFLNDIKDCDEMTLDSYAKRPVTMKVKESISRLLAPLL
ncbi:MAG TPA: cardiolipin synthase [Bacillota bacterium]|nr:cardiolipin synthase [Bacillota bacterium]